MTIPASVKEIEVEAFYECTSLKEVAFAEEGQLKMIGKHSFYGSGLEEFIAPPGLKEIERGAFMNCKSLTNVVLNEGLTTLGEHDIYSDGYSEKTCGVFQESGLEEITLPNTLTIIGRSAFA